MEPKLMDSMTLERMTFTDQSTIGELRIDGDFFCFTLEDTCRDHKIAGVTAVPAGKYQIIVDYSERFKRVMPLLLDVPGYTGVRIHPGNTPGDTEGCILVGLKRGDDAIYDSRLAYDRLYAEIEKRLKNGKQFISIIGGTHVRNLNQLA